MIKVNIYVRLEKVFFLPGPAVRSSGRPRVATLETLCSEAAHVWTPRGWKMLVPVLPPGVGDSAADQALRPDLSLSLCQEQSQSGRLIF